MMPAKSQMSRYTLILIIGLSTCMLLGLSWQRLYASLRFLPVDTAKSKYWDTEESNTAQLKARAREAIALHDHYRYWSGLSELQILSSQDMDKPNWQRRQFMEQAIISARAVVERAPADPRAWLRIARIRANLGYSSDDVIPAWKMSILTGRVEPTLMLVRLELGLTYFNALDDEAVMLLRDQAVLTWAIKRRQVVNGLKNGSLDIDLMRKILAGYNEDVMAEMEAHLVNAG
jgi:hypothetical protein